MMSKIKHIISIVIFLTTTCELFSLPKMHHIKRMCTSEYYNCINDDYNPSTVTQITDTAGNQYDSTDIIVTFIDNVQHYQRSTKIVTGKTIGSDFIDPSTFNINEYMSIFNSITLKNKHKLVDYYYLDNFHDAYPYIYVRKKNFDLIKSINKKANKINLKGKEIETFLYHRKYYYLTDSTNKAKYNVMPNDSKIGYFQYLFFCEFGENFALKWHAAKKSSKKIICTNKDMAEIVHYYTAGLENELFEVDSIAMKSLLCLDVCPIVNMTDDKCFITVFEHHWSRAIYRNTYEIARYAPYSIVLSTSEELVEIGALFIY